MTYSFDYNSCRENNDLRSLYKKLYCRKIGYCLWNSKKSNVSAIYSRPLKQLALKQIFIIKNRMLKCLWNELAVSFHLDITDIFDFFYYTTV